MPLDVLGCTRATLMRSTSFPAPEGVGNLVKGRHFLEGQLVFSQWKWEAITGL